MDHKVRFSKKSITVDGKRIEGCWSIENGYKFTSKTSLPKWLADSEELYEYLVNEKKYAVIFKASSKAFNHIKNIINKKDSK